MDKNYNSINGDNGTNLPTSLTLNNHYFKKYEAGFGVASGFDTFFEEISYSAYTPPQHGGDYNSPGGSPNGGMGLISGSANSNRSNGGEAYLKLEWFERPEN